MKPTDLEKELEEARKSLEKADRQIKSLLAERKQNQLILEMLETAGFIKEGKLEEARQFVYSFYS